jgi:hypothetical protein
MDELKMVNVVLASEITTKVVSKVTKNRNYCIRTYDNYASLTLKRNARTSAFLTEIEEHNIHWFFFSKIKDAREVLENLRINGYNTIDWTK